MEPNYTLDLARVWLFIAQRRDVWWGGVKGYVMWVLRVYWSMFAMGFRGLCLPCLEVCSSE